MKRHKLKRIFRGRKLTPAEIARDKEIRQKVMTEFPPGDPKVRRTDKK